MTTAVLLDTGPLGVLTNPNHTAARRTAERWLADPLAAGRRVTLSDMCDYELRRELLRRRGTRAIGRLDWLHT